MAAGNTENEGPSPDQLAKLLELELQQKRAGWQQRRQRFGAIRVASFIFLFLVIIGALSAWYFLSPDQLHGARPERALPATATPSPVPTR